MRTFFAFITMLLFSDASAYAQTTTAKKTTANAANAPAVAEINHLYDSMQRAIEVEYSKLINENKKNIDDLNEKIKQLDKQAETLKEQARKLEEMQAKMKELMSKMMKQLGADRQKAIQWASESSEPNHLKYNIDSLRRILPKETASKKDSLWRLVRIHH